VEEEEEGVGGRRRLLEHAGLRIGLKVVVVGVCVVCGCVRACVRACVRVSHGYASKVLGSCSRCRCQI
jgi:hypothetical protein